MKRLAFFYIALISIISIHAETKNNHMFFDLAGVYMGTTNAQFRNDILTKGAIVPSIGAKDLEDTYDIFFEGEIIRLYSINHEKTNRIDRIGVAIYRDSKDAVIALLKSFTKRELSKHNCQLEEFEANGYPAFGLLVFAPNDKDQKKDPVGAIDIRIIHEDDEVEYELQIIYDDWVD